MRGLTVITVTTDRSHDLVRKAQLGDRKAFEEVIADVEASLRSTVRSRIGPRLRGKLDPEDVFQDTVTRALESLDSFEWQGEGSFLRWLRGIAENLIRAEADKQRRRAVLELERPPSPPSHVSADRGLRREERFDRLEKALRSLRPDHREVIMLARIDGLQIREIAERLGRSTSAVKNLLLRALKELKDSFGDTESFHLPDRPLEGRGDADGK
jgi:RNA polymerase sigma-70 factor (ECF subfamily)